MVSTRIFLSMPFSLATDSRMLPRLVLSLGVTAAVVAMTSITPFFFFPVDRSGATGAPPECGLTPCSP